MAAKRVLIVDDEPNILVPLEFLMKREGYEVRCAQDGEAGLQAVRDWQPDLVLLDIWMPDTDGVTLLKEWASNGQLTMPVIMMSGHATIDTAVEATRFGALDFLEKPIALARLLAAVKSGLERGRIMRNLRATAAPAAAARPAEPAGGADGATVRTVSFGGAGGVSLDQPLREARDQFERMYFEYHLARENYSMTRVADRAGLERTHLYRKLKQLGVELGRGGRRAERNGPESDGESGGGSN
ncbi:MAG: response regulator [Burkholderiaceae bacterium]|nr:response regulator [Burkholderiaceae bacterium]